MRTSCVASRNLRSLGEYYECGWYQLAYFDVVCRRAIKIFECQKPKSVMKFREQIGEHFMDLV